MPGRKRAALPTAAPADRPPSRARHGAAASAAGAPVAATAASGNAAQSTADDTPAPAPATDSPGGGGAVRVPVFVVAYLQRAHTLIHKQVFSFTSTPSQDELGTAIASWGRQCTTPDWVGDLQWGEAVPRRFARIPDTNEFILTMVARRNGAAGLEADASSTEQSDGIAASRQRAQALGAGRPAGGTGTGPRGDDPLPEVLRTAWQSGEDWRAAFDTRGPAAMILSIVNMTATNCGSVSQQFGPRGLGGSQDGGAREPAADGAAAAAMGASQPAGARHPLFGDITRGELEALVYFATRGMAGQAGAAGAVRPECDEASQERVREALVCAHQAQSASAGGGRAPLAAVIVKALEYLRAWKTEQLLQTMGDTLQTMNRKLQDMDGKLDAIARPSRSGEGARPAAAATASPPTSTGGPPTSNSAPVPGLPPARPLLRQSAERAASVSQAAADVRNGCDLHQEARDCAEVSQRACTRDDQTP